VNTYLAESNVADPLNEPAAPQPPAAFPLCARFPAACPPPGVYKNVPESEYHSWAAASASLLKGFAELDGCASKVRHYMDGAERAPSDDQHFGTAYHQLCLLGREAFASRYGVAPDQVGRTDKGKTKTVTITRASPEWKELADRHGADNLLWQSEIDQIDRMHSRLMAHPSARSIVTGAGMREVCVVWDDPDTGIRCKARADFVNKSPACAADLKTAADGSPDGFGKAAGGWLYHLSAAWYLRGLGILFGNARMPFWFVVQEKTGSYEPAVYVLTESERRDGERRATGALSQLARCLRTGEWPGYGDQPQVLRLRTWFGGPTPQELELMENPDE
jgi:hypothetical protein